MYWFKESHGLARYRWWRYVTDSKRPFLTTVAHIRRNFRTGGWEASITINPARPSRKQTFRSIPAAKRWIESELES